VDHLKSSHKDPKVNDQFKKWLQHNYRAHREVTINQGKIHKYLGMEIELRVKGKVKTGMIECIENMGKDFPEEIKSTDTVILRQQGMAYSMKAKE
jgi:hypothetical protein